MPGSRLLHGVVTSWKYDAAGALQQVAAGGGQVAQLPGGARPAAPGPAPGSARGPGGRRRARCWSPPRRCRRPPSGRSLDLGRGAACGRRPAGPGVATPSFMWSTRLVPPAEERRLGLGRPRCARPRRRRRRARRRRASSARPPPAPLTAGTMFGVGRAAAQVAAHPLADLGVGRARRSARQVLGDVRWASPRPTSLSIADRRADLAGRAVAALEGVVVDEGPLHRVQLAAREPARQRW